MSITSYHFISHWHVESTCEEIYAIIDNVVDFMRWYPSVYSNVVIQQPGDDRGIGRVVSLDTKGWLPYTLQMIFRVTAADYPHSITLEASGDVAGTGIWTFEQDGQWVHITYTWNVRADKPLLRYGSFLFKPLFEVNHDWVMQMGEKSLQLELARRHAPTDEARAMIPPPPAPAGITPRQMIIGIAVLLGTGAALLYLRKKRS